jgi:hypothetical protein
MPNASTQTIDQNERLFRGNRQNYFDCERIQRYRNVEIIKKLIYESDLRKFCNNLGLKVTELKLTPNDDNVRDIPTVVTVSPINVSEDAKIFRWTVAKDLTNMSCLKYRLIRKIFKSLNFGNIPGWKKVMKKQHEINDLFKLEEPNQKGFYYEPSKKIQFVCEKFLLKNEEFLNSGDRTFKIKLSADSMNLSKKHLNILNITFNLLNDKKKAMSVFGTYILGKFF